MSTNTVKQIAAYQQSTPAPLFLSGMFQSPPENFHNSKEVELDIQRDGEEIAVPVANLGSGYTQNITGGFTTKKAEPPTYKEAESIPAIDLVERVAGQNIYADPSFEENAVKRALQSARRLENKIRRGLEVQASQILTTGALALKNSAGTTVYAQTYGAKGTHFAGVSTHWDDTGADPTKDLIAMCDLIRADGKTDVKRVIMGAGSLEAALSVESFMKRFTAVNANVGQINPIMGGTQGGNLHGFIIVGDQRLDIWTYGAYYTDPATGLKVKYVPNEKVILMSDARLDATFGGIPNFGTDGRALQFLPGRMGRPSQGIDMHFNLWISPDGENLNIGIGARPLLIPTAVDSFGCLDTGI